MKFLTFVGDNSTAINTIVGVVGTLSVVGVYIYVGVAAVRAFMPKKETRQYVDYTEVEVATDEA